jgi:hypothetical protein
MTPIKDILAGLPTEDLDTIYRLLDDSPDGLIELHISLEDELRDRGIEVEL